MEKKKNVKRKGKSESRDGAGRKHGTVPGTAGLWPHCCCCSPQGQGSPWQSQHLNYLGMKLKLCPKPSPPPENHLKLCVRALQML